MPEYALDYELDFDADDGRGQNVLEQEIAESAEFDYPPLSRFTWFN